MDNCYIYHYCFSVHLSSCLLLLPSHFLCSPEQQLHTSVKGCAPETELPAPILLIILLWLYKRMVVLDLSLTHSHNTFVYKLSSNEILHVGIAYNEEYLYWYLSNIDFLYDCSKMWYQYFELFLSPSPPFLALQLYIHSSKINAQINEVFP